MKKFWPIIVIALVCVIPTFRFLFGGLTPAPVDQIHQLAPWNESKPTVGWDVLTLDGALQFLPWRDTMLYFMQRGEVPLWNPYSFGGSPFLANSQTAPFYPLHWLLAPTGIEAETLMSFSAWLHLFIAGCGVFGVCRHLGASEVGGLLGATAFSLSAFMLGWLQLPSVGMTSSWIPWCLLGVFRIFESPSFKTTALLSMAVGMMLLAGHLQFAMYGLMASAMCAIWLGFATRSLRSVSFVSVALLFGAGLASVQLLPALELGRQGHRSTSPSVESYDAYRRMALQPHHFAVAYAPGIFGMPYDVIKFGEQQVNGYWLGLSEPGRNYAELPLYMGPFVVPLSLLSIVAFLRRWKVSFFVALVALGLLMSFDTFVSKAMFFTIPGWAATGSPGRASVLVILGMCVLAGLAFCKEPLGLSNKAAAICLAWVALGVVVTAMWGSQLTEQIQSEAFVRSAPFLSLSMIGVILSWSVFDRGRKALYVQSAVVMVSVAALLVSQWGLNPGSKRGLYKEPFPGIELLTGDPGALTAVINSSWSFYEPPTNGVAPPNSLLPYRITTLDGYDSLIPQDTKRFLDEVNGGDSAPPANGNMMFIKPAFDEEKLKSRGVRWVLSAIPLDLPIAYTGENYWIYELPGSSETIITGATATWCKMKVANGFAQDKLAQMKSLGWHVARESSDGYHELEYLPGAYVLGFILTIFSLAAVVTFYRI